ncbi:hypothetical protein DICPUDRAFT_157057 [Dictyostelium purpureum]|uniref:Uncharacterized protein n=1 Tax=Dictyostelium purpureum TaxID=5786 RepID=F0ZY57_DICPU|nr:uncharacterized protein DICPUDRAFT_157057 [Dictyostelium purpureum]EGC31136.1 hypothetical protein DICPUDRAFT_157057 [Dictyostelium purpureum]|eukprot:XP_003292354.1 hypothetical protein DICPUDRAFT_157057 [Dictyostelium purpureum]
MSSTNRSPPPQSSTNRTNSGPPQQPPMFNKFLIYSWLVAQSATTLFTLSYLFIGNPNFYYRSLLAAAIAYIIPIFKSNEGKKPTKELAMQILQNENAQLVLYCIIFYFLATPSLIYLVPNFIYSFYHLLNKIIPLTGRVPFVQSLLQKLKSQQEKARGLAVSLEINIFIFLIISIFTTGLYGIIIVMVYFRYLKIRYVYNASIKQRIAELDMAVNQIQAHPNCPGFIRNLIPKIRYYISIYIFNLKYYSFEPLFKNDLPPFINSLTFEYLFNQKIYPNLLPASIQTLRFMGNYNMELEIGTIPQSVINLEFGYFFDQSINKIGLIPPSVKKLIFGSCFNQKITIVGAIPPSVEELSLGTNYNHELSKGIIPSSVIFLKLPTNYSKPINQGDLPDSIVTLVLPNDYNHPLTLEILPKSLKTIKYNKETYTQFEDIAQFITNFNKSTK